MKKNITGSCRKSGGKRKIVKELFDDAGGMWYSFYISIKLFKEIQSIQVTKCQSA